MLTNLAKRLALVPVVMVLASFASADVLIDNMAEPVRDTTPIDANLWASQGFQPDLSQDYVLNGITIEAGDLYGDPGITAELRASVDGHPDPTDAGLLSTLSVPDLTGPISERLFVPDSPVVLEPGTRYFICLGVTGSGGFGWNYANSNIWEGLGAFANYEYSTDGGASWVDFGNDFPYKMRVDVSPNTYTEAVNPFSYTVLSGFEFAGNIESLYSSDDDCLGIFPDDTTLIAQVLFDGQTTILEPIQYSLTVETFVSRPGLSQEVRIMNFDSTFMESMDGRVAPVEDTVVAFTITDFAGSYVGAAGELEADIIWQPINDEDPAQDGWLHCIDWVYWELVS